MSARPEWMKKTHTSIEPYEWHTFCRDGAQGWGTVFVLHTGKDSRLFMDVSHPKSEQPSADVMTEGLEWCKTMDARRMIPGEYIPFPAEYESARRRNVLAACS